LNVTAIEQTVPAATTVFPVGSIVQPDPVMLPSVYSVKFEAILIDVIGTAVFTVNVTVCWLDCPTGVDGNDEFATVKVGEALHAVVAEPSRASTAVIGPTARRPRRAQRTGKLTSLEITLILL
jgi:hypothetical protein